MNIATTRHQLREARVVVALTPAAAGALVEVLAGRRR